MTEHTSLDASKRLAEAGLEEETDKKWIVSICNKSNRTLVSVDQFVDSLSTWITACRAYRSDTLLAWLVSQEYQIAVGHSHDGKRYTAFYTNEKGEHNTRRELADTIPDALAEVVLKVLEVSK